MINEAKQMHRDLMNALLPILLRAVYHDIRRVVNLIWAIVGLCMTYTVRLEAWSEIFEDRAHWLDPTPDEVPVVASRRKMASQSKWQWDISLHW